MRWKNEVYRKREMDRLAGTTRIVRKFLWWPKSLKSSHTRWLEFADIEEKCVKQFMGQDTGFIYFWEEIRFMPTDLDSDGNLTD